MKTNIRFIFMILILIIAISGCKKQNPEESTSSSEILKNDYAEGFSITKTEDGYLLRLFDVNNSTPLNEILLTDKKSEQNNNYQQLEIPLEKIVIGSSTFIGFLNTLDKIEVIQGFPGKQLIYNKELLARIEKGKVTDLGNQISWNVEKVAEMNPDAMILNLFGAEDPSIENIRKLGIPVIFVQDFQETHPLGKAEWIKVFGLLTGEYEKSVAIFEEIKNNYLVLKEKLGTVKNKPGVTSGMVYEDAWFAPGGHSYMATLISDAGGNYIWSDKEGTGGIPLAKEVVLTRADQADYWIGAAAFDTYEKLKEHDKLFESIKAVENKNVYTYIGKIRKNGGNDYFETAPVNPDILLKDIVLILHPEMISNHKLVYYKALK
ncbi:ABC transporter substrate-binding protein [Mangrovivirga sp. M17]|uniref:ABC transporter substrate-binding protein n=1 Tax=Mangrovivirga halotolerans TaxID=2993936 RepID=A0ABT3RTK3_9BACT|nr:ABC transporter substrate-binding protein [Mangrovivirga halotolerans]MCX2745109.1 ABC transporter substrate-binding protein [Mangrovivirga halotolerans]